jgi:nitric oxide reductase NorQ protein
MTTDTFGTVTAFVGKKDSADLARLNAHHANLAQKILAVLGQTANAELKRDILEPSYTKSTRAARKSLIDPFADRTVAPVEDNTITGGAEYYVRPNGEKYYPRPWGSSGHDDVGVMRMARKHSLYVFAYGAPGCGKTALAEAAYGDDLYVIVGTGDTEVGDFIGGYTTDAAGSYVWVDGPLIRAMEEGKMLLIDEVGLVDTKVMSVVYSAMDGRREIVVTANPERGTVAAKEGFGITGATNPNAPGVRLSEALLSRFVVNVEMTTDWELAKKLGVPRVMVGIAKKANDKVNEGKMTWAPQFRELLAYRDIEKIFGTNFAQANIMAACPEIERAEFRDLMQRSSGGAGSTIPMPARI